MLSFSPNCSMKLKVKSFPWTKMHSISEMQNTTYVNPPSWTEMVMDNGILDSQRKAY